MKSFNELEFYKITIKLNFMNDALELNNRKNNRLIIIIMEKIVEIKLSDAEKAKLSESAEGVKKTNADLDGVLA